MSSVIQKILAVLFPRRCPVCGEFTDSQSPHLCRSCAEALMTEYAKHCPVCKRTAATCSCLVSALSKDPCPVTVLGFYEPGNTGSVSSRLVYALKHQTDDGAAHVFARDLSGAILRAFLIAGEDIRTWTVTFTPRSDLGYEENGFDQAKRLAKLFARYTGARYEPIFRRRGGEEQKDLSAKEREENATTICLRHPRRKHAGKYIVVDDIMTSGATMAECIRLLSTHGAESVRIAVPLRTMPRQADKELWYASLGNNIQ